ncbi:Tetracycline resistance protein, class G [Symbiodinium microadriaticum]|uniref:Tetracycline resistance protein, class G n=1 Tax=Symbiodinium microadriaticum TaxID=2951 RepID=A0A1Q9E6F3_SYMMI|nr:Tetracycline resistance protein, class G [Symbiodinium microadriaticum]
MKSGRVWSMELLSAAGASEQKQWDVDVIDTCAQRLTVPVEAIWMVCLTVFIDSLGGSISAPVMPHLSAQVVMGFYAKEFDASSTQVGRVSITVGTSTEVLILRVSDEQLLFFEAFVFCWLFSTYSLAQVIALPLLGRLSDTTGRRPVLVLSLFGAATGAFVQGAKVLQIRFGNHVVTLAQLDWQAQGHHGLAPTLDVLFLGRVISGFCGAVGGAAGGDEEEDVEEVADGSTANVYICDVASEDCRPEPDPKYLGYLMSSNGLAFAFGPGLGGGLSKLGRNVPIMEEYDADDEDAEVDGLSELRAEVNGALCMAAGLLAIVEATKTADVTTEAEEQQATQAVDEISAAAKSKNCKLPTFSLKIWLVCTAEFLRGVSFSAIFAIFALFASTVFGLDSVSIGFAVCCGALCLIGTNIWICPHLDHVLGHVGCACLGMMLIASGEAPWRQGVKTVMAVTRLDWL